MMLSGACNPMACPIHSRGVPRLTDDLDKLSTELANIFTDIVKPLVHVSSPTRWVTSPSQSVVVWLNIEGILGIALSTKIFIYLF